MRKEPLSSIFFNPPIFAMNLNNKKEKKIRCITQLENINLKYNIVESVNTLNIKKLYGNYRQPGEIGYVSTIRSIIKDFLNNYDNEYVIILDDDIMFNKNFTEKIKSYNSELTDFDVLYLGASEWSNFNFDNIDKNYYIPNTKKTKYGDGTCGSFANIYKRSFLQRFYKYFCNIDDAFDRSLKNFLDKGNSIAYVLYPNLVITSIIDSDIRKNKDSDVTNRIEKMKWDYNNYYDINSLPPLFSFAIITYNRGKFLPNTIQNILDQYVENNKLDPKYYEIIILDDASTDGTENIISSYIKIPNIHYYKNSKQLGIPCSRNKINNLCNGKYIVVTDDDDIILNNRIESIVDKLSYNDGKFAGTNSGWINFNLTENKLGSFQSGGLMTPETLLFSGGIAMHPAICYRKDVILEITYPEDIPFNSDWAVLSEIVCNGYKFNNTNSYNIIKIDHNSCVTNTKPRINYARIYRVKLLDRFYQDPEFGSDKKKKRMLERSKY